MAAVTTFLRVRALYGEDMKPMTFKGRIAGTLVAAAVVAGGLGAVASSERLSKAVECLGKSPITALVARGNALAMVP